MTPEERAAYTREYNKQYYLQSGKAREAFNNSIDGLGDASVCLNCTEPHCTGAASCYFRHKRKKEIAMGTNKNHLKEARIAKGLSQREVAVTLDVVNATVYYWESGKYLPDEQMMNRLAELYGKAPEELIENYAERKIEARGKKRRNTKPESPEIPEIATEMPEIPEIATESPKTETIPETEIEKETAMETTTTTTTTEGRRIVFPPEKPNGFVTIPTRAAKIVAEYMDATMLDYIRQNDISLADVRELIGILNQIEQFVKDFGTDEVLAR